MKCSHLYMPGTDPVLAFRSFLPRTGPCLGATSEIHKIHRMCSQPHRRGWSPRTLSRQPHDGLELSRGLDFPRTEHSCEVCMLTHERLEWFCSISHPRRRSPPSLYPSQKTLPLFAQFAATTVPSEPGTNCPSSSRVPSTSRTLELMNHFPAGLALAGIAQRFQSRASHNWEKSLIVSGPWPA